MSANRRVSAQSGAADRIYDAAADAIFHTVCQLTTDDDAAGPEAPIWFDEPGGNDDDLGQELWSVVNDYARIVEDYRSRHGLPAIPDTTTTVETTIERQIAA